MNRQRIAGTLLALAAGLPATAAAQPVSPAEASEIETRIAAALDAEQAAFEAGDCEAVVGFYEDRPNLFVVSGRTIPDRNALLGVCRSLPRNRAGRSREVREHVVHVIGANSAYTITYYDTRSPDGASGTQVVTKVWVRPAETWLIAHVHESVTG